MEIFRKWWFYLILIIILIPAAVLAALLIPNSQTPAFLHSASGTVEVDQGNGFVPAAVGMELRESDRIRTGSNSTAIVVLYEHIIIRLEEGSTVTISELDEGKQVVEQEGSVWTKVAHLSGTENYQANTPTTVATVRGTSFRIRFNGTHYEIMTADGEVLLYQGIMSCAMDDPQCGVAVKAMEKLLMDPDHASVYTALRQNLTEEDLAAIRQQLRIELDVLRDLRLREVLKNDMIMGIARSRYDATDEDVAQYLIDIDEGRASEDDIRAQAPLVTADMERIFAYNAVIRELLQLQEY